MKIEISQASERKLIGRKDVAFALSLEKPAATPSMMEVRKLLAAKGGFDVGGTLIVRMGHRTGTSRVEGIAHVYPTEEEAKRWEPRHVIIANLEASEKKQALEQLKKSRLEAKAARSGAPGAGGGGKK
jgi:ribosomal protein S24E